MSRKRQALILVFILVIIIIIAWDVSKTSTKEALEIAADASGVKGGIEAIEEEQYNVGKYYQDTKHVGYDVQLQYEGKYYFYTISKKDGEILGSKKLDSVEEFPVKNFPVIVKEKNN